VDKEKDFKYKEIKLRNDALKVGTYDKYFNKTPAKQNRLMLAFYIKTGKIQMKLIQLTLEQLKSSSNYRKYEFEVLARDVHPIDQIELHKQAGKVIYSTMTNKAMILHKLQSLLDSITTHYKLEKASS